MQEILTADEFAQRLKIGRSSLFEWMRKGVLIPGKHYFKVGRVLRFVWSDEAIMNLLELSAESDDGGAVCPSAPASVVSSKRGSKRGIAINWDY